ncbi:putative uncharacterized protein FLJ44672 [Pongo pygmaeus]|uniref:putative uncharacterized protein FLJ44672 n=1 Tax=Pongo pygmaeus TaxID=9600 RepID=UPI00300D07AD
MASPGPAFASQKPSPNKVLPASQQPQQAQILLHTHLIRPSSYLTVTCPGPAPAPRQAVHARNFLKSASRASPEPELPQVGLSRPRFSSQWPLQAQTVVKSAYPGSAPASRRPLQAQVVLKSASPGPAPASWRPLRVQKFLDLSRPGLLPLEGLHRPSLCLTADYPRPSSPRLTAASPVQSSCLLAASAGPAPACQWPLQAHGAHSSQWPFQAQFFPSGGLCGPRTSSSWPLQTHLRPPGVLSRPSSSSRLRLQARLRPPNNSLDSAPAQLPVALVGPQLPEAKLPRPSSGHTVASPGSAPALRRRLQAPNGVRSVGSSWPSLGLPATSAGPGRPEVGLSRPSSGLPASKLFWLSSCPAPAGLCRPRTFSSQALQAHLLPPGA